MVLLYTRSGGEVVDSIERPAFGTGEEQVELVAEYDGKSDFVQLEIGEQEPDEEELERFFASALEAALPQVLGDNTDFSNVSGDLNLITQLENGIKVEWQVSDPTVVNIFGTLGEDIPMEGASVQLQMKLIYGDYSKSYEIPVSIRPDETVEDEAAALTEYINDVLASDPQAASAKLPKEYHNSALILHQKSNTVAQNLAWLVLIAAILLWVNGSSRLEEAYKKRSRQMELDYPEMVSRLSILLSAGLTIPAAWERLAADYNRELEQGGDPRDGFEELRLTALELSNTGYSGQLFRDFGRRCGSYHYMKLADILEQSMQKGTVQLTVFMEQEAIQAFELRKMQAAKTGEEAGTKLLLPMMMMFGLVIAMVVVPAWSGMKL
jgi:hypothetical protein